MLIVVRHVLVCTGCTVDCVCPCTDFMQFDHELHNCFTIDVSHAWKVVALTLMHSSTQQVNLPVNRPSKLLGCVYLQRPQPVLAGQPGSQLDEPPVLVSGAGHDGLAMADLTEVQLLFFIASPYLH